MQFLANYYRTFSPAIGAATLLSILSYCAAHSSLRKSRKAPVELGALVAALAAGVIVPVVYAAARGASRGQWGAMLPVTVAVLLPILVAAPLYRTLASRGDLVATGVAAGAGVVISPACTFAGFLTGCVLGVSCFRL